MERASSHLHIRFDCADTELDRRALRREARRILRDAGCSGDLSVVFIDDESMRRLNRDFRAIDRTTDVLAFPQSQDAESIPAAVWPPVLGDIAISLPAARRQAPRYGHSLASEVRRLLVHGVVHLAGFDHKSPAEARAMRSEERRILSAFGAT